MRDKRLRRDFHGLTVDGRVACNPRDQEAAHRATAEGIATENLAAVTCKKCLDVLHRARREEQR